MPARYLVNITKSAETDIEAIWHYIAADDRQAADRFVDELQNQMATLERFPSRCPVIPEAELLRVDYRHIIYFPYRTIFRLAEKIVIVMRVVHGARLLDATFFES